MPKIHVKLLKKARKLIESGEQDYTCIALQVVIQSEAINAKKLDAYVKLREHIEDLLDGEASLELWLLVNYGVGLLTKEPDELLKDAAKFRRTRLAWIDDMIEYWRDK